ncbi:MAG: DNA-3-methyladenine glycosylase I [Bacteroidia bacterium]|nr:DNA-3-methyladenine glycosylase I [Bacteroidia bacterium]
MSTQLDTLRCPWCLKDDLYKQYHDLEWGRPSKDDKHLFEMMILESFQAGLSWYTILAKRENFRKAFAQFDVKKVALFDETKVIELMNDAGIIRNRLKILAAISNAKLFIEIQKTHGSFAQYLWGFTNHQVIDNRPIKLSDIPAKSVESDAMAADLKKRGFKFMGSTVCYAKMQSIGMVNDHLMDCHCRNKTK